MRIEVRLFAYYRELLGSESVALDVNPGSSPREVFRLLLGKHPESELMLSSTLFAVDRAYVDPDTKLVKSCEVSILPPMAGG